MLYYSHVIYSETVDRRCVIYYALIDSSHAITITFRCIPVNIITYIYIVRTIILY